MPYTLAIVCGTLYFSFSQFLKCTNNLIHTVMKCNHIKVMLEPYVADSWVLVKPNNISCVESRSSLVGLWRSGWGHIQQAAPLEMDIKWVSNSLAWLWSTAQ